MGLQFMATVYADKAVDRDAMTQTARWLIEDDMGTVFVSERDGAVTGMIGMTIYSHPISGLPTATEMFWWVAPEHRGHGLRLLSIATTWAKAAGAVELQMIAPTPEVGRLYARLGYTLVETAYARTL